MLTCDVVLFAEFVVHFRWELCEQIYLKILVMFCKHCEIDLNTGYFRYQYHEVKTSPKIWNLLQATVWLLTFLLQNLNVTSKLMWTLYIFPSSIFCFHLASLGRNQECLSFVLSIHQWTDNVAPVKEDVTLSFWWTAMMIPQCTWQVVIYQMKICGEIES